MKIIVDEIKQEIKEEMYGILDSLIEENGLDDYVDWDTIDKSIDIDIKIVNKFLSDSLTDVINRLEVEKEINEIPNEKTVMYRLTAKENDNAVFCVVPADKSLENITRYIINRVTKVPENGLTKFERNRILQMRNIDCRKEVLADIIRTMIEGEIKKAIEDGDGIIMQTYRLTKC